jgi:hypothetical protein
LLRRSVRVALAGLFAAGTGLPSRRTRPRQATPATRQGRRKPAPAAEKPPAKEEEPFWAAGRPKTDAAMKMAPVAAHPIRRPPTSCGQQDEAAARLQGRSLGEQHSRCPRHAPGDKGTVFVSSLFVAGKI